MSPKTTQSLLSWREYFFFQPGATYKEIETPLCLRTTAVNYNIPKSRAKPVSHLTQEKECFLQVFASTAISCRKSPIQRDGEGLPCTSAGLEENKAIRSLWWAALALSENKFWYSVELDREVSVTCCAQRIGVVMVFPSFGYEHHEWQQYVCLLGSCLHRTLWHIAYMPGACCPPVLLP